MLTALFMQALLTSVILGFGLTAVFSDLELRRYPRQCRASGCLVRHLIGIIDPFWFLFLALELGLVVGLYVAGRDRILPGARRRCCWFFVANYLTARVLAIVVDRMMQNKAGGAMLTAFVLLVSLGAGAAGALVKSNPWIQIAHRQGAAVHAALRRCGGDDQLRIAPRHAGYAVIFAWLAALTGAADRCSNAGLRYGSGRESATMSWESPFERFTAWLGVENAPLVAYWLRFYVRNSRFRTLYLLALPLVGFLTFNFGRAKNGPGFFPAALGTFALVSFMGTSRFSVNQFGYAGGRLPPLLPAAGSSRRGAGGSQQGLHPSGRAPDSAGGARMGADRAGAFRRAHAGHAAGQRRGRTVRAARPRACGPASTARAAAITTRPSATIFR